MSMSIRLPLSFFSYLRARLELFVRSFPIYVFLLEGEGHESMISWGEEGRLGCLRDGLIVCGDGWKGWQWEGMSLWGCYD